MQADLYREIWQAFPFLLAPRTVGVMGDHRTYPTPLRYAPSPAMTA